MPQMAPISWLILFIMFSISFLLINMMNYFSFNQSISTSKKYHFKYNSMNWKW